MTSLNEILSSCTEQGKDILSATFNYGQDTFSIDKSHDIEFDGDIEKHCGKESIKEEIDDSNMNISECNDLVSYKSKNLNATNKKGLPFSFPLNNEDHDIALKVGFNETFDPNKKIDDKVLTIPLDETLNLSSCGAKYLKFEHPLSTPLDSEDSLGIIPAVLDDNTSLDLLDPFQSHKNSIPLINKFQQKNCFSFSPARITKVQKTYLAERNSPLKKDCKLRFTSTPKPLSSKVTSLLQHPETDCITKRGIDDEKVELNDFEEFYEDLTKGKIFTSTSKGSPLQDSLKMLDTTNILNGNSTIEKKEVPILLNATFEIKPESVPEVSPLKVHSSENISRNKTITVENVNNATKVFENEVKSSRDILETVEMNKHNVTEIISQHSSLKIDNNNVIDQDSCLVESKMQASSKIKSKLRKSISGPMQKIDPLINGDSYLVEGKKQIGSKSKIKLRKSLSMTQKLDRPMIRNNQCSGLNSTMSLDYKKASSSTAPNFAKRYSLGAVPTSKTRSSTSGLLKTHPFLKTSKCVDSEVTENKGSYPKNAYSSLSFKKRDSLINQKSSTSNPRTNSIIKPKVLQNKNKLKDETFVDVDEKTSLDGTFVKDEGANVITELSKILEEGCSNESQLETPSPANGTFSLTSDNGVDRVDKVSESLSKDVTNLATIQTEGGKKAIVAEKEPSEMPVIKKGNETFGLKKDKASKKNILVKPKGYKDKLGIENNIKNMINFPEHIKKKELNICPSSKNSKQLPIKNQNINLNEKNNFLTTNKEQNSSLPTLRSTFSKRTLPEKSKINGKMQIESKDPKASFPSQSNLNNVKSQKKASAQTARSLRPPEALLPKENANKKNSPVSNERVAFGDEIAKTEKYVSKGILKPKVENTLPGPKEVDGIKTGSKIPARNASRQIPSLRKIVPPRTYSR